MRTRHYHVTSGMPGYLPEGDVQTYATLADARAALANERDEMDDAYSHEIVGYRTVRLEDENYPTQEPVVQRTSVTRSGSLRDGIYVWNDPESLGWQRYAEMTRCDDPSCLVCERCEGTGRTDGWWNGPEPDTDTTRRCYDCDGTGRIL